MKNLQPIKSLLFVLLCSVCITSCTKDDINVDTTSISVNLKSTIGRLDKVYMNIIDVQLKIKETSNAEDWLSLNMINQGTHDVSNLSEDSPLLLVDNLEIEASYIYEIRLVLGENNFIDINNILHSLETSSLGNATPSNIINTELSSKRRYDIVIDVDIDESVSFNEQENMMVLNPKLYTAIRQIEY
ncbi:DUF4382 domain-containing protein [Winogradskyella sp. PE311]|uniref:DUF4382 domain-containing protein n=1 Tax=Winogradskyella sp. PE311 TaxID=3366943 RepID=UPI00397EC66C